MHDGYVPPIWAQVDPAGFTNDPKPPPGVKTCVKKCVKKRVTKCVNTYVKKCVNNCVTTCVNKCVKQGVNKCVKQICETNV